VSLLYLAVLALFGWLMITRRLTATLALPLTAIAIALIVLLQAVANGQPALVVLDDLVKNVFEAGVSRLSAAIFAVILGAVLAAQMKLSGAAERLVRYAAEYAGEDQFWLGFVLLLVIALLFTVLGGLGAVILVASVTLPLLLALGYDPKVAGALFLFGLSLGGTLNPANWALYKGVLELPEKTIVPFAATVFGIFLAVCVAYLLFHNRGRWQTRIPVIAGLLLLAGGLVWIARNNSEAWTQLKVALSWAMLALLALLMLLAFIRAIGRGLGSTWLAGPDNWLSALSVLIPLLLLLWSSLNAGLAIATTPAPPVEGAAVDSALPAPIPFAIPILTALLAGVVYAALAGFDRDGQSLNRLMRALHDGVAAAGPAVVLLVGIGLLLQATMLPAVNGTLEPWVAKLPVHSVPSFIATFFILSPLALYRGPLNLFGMGAPVVGIIHGSGILESSLIMVAFLSVGMLQGVCDPTNTHNVWISSFCKVPVAELTRHTLPWVLAIVLLGLTAGALMFAPH
jgi:hypothetical protein